MPVRALFLKSTMAHYLLIKVQTEVGGVWLENTYPGVACDIPAPCFAFLFEDNPDWSSYYAGGKEINDYIRNVATKYQVRRFIKFRHLVTHAEWAEDEGKWHLRIYDQANDRVRNTCRSVPSVPRR